MNFTVYFILLSTLFYSSVDGQYLTNHQEFVTSFSPFNRPRMAAEWEPAIGTLIVWPLSIPHKLVIELAKDNRLYVLVANRQAQQDAVSWFTKWHINPSQVKFITAPQGVDVSWTRDWGPHMLFAPDGYPRLADGKYLYATPLTGLLCDDTLQHIYMDDQHRIMYTLTDDKIPGYIAAALDIELVSLPFAFTGGNVICDGQRSGFSTCALTNENRFSGVSDERFHQGLRLILGIENHHIISNFEERGIQHIDCFMKLLDEERLFVMRPPADHPSYEIYEGIIKHELSGLKNAFGRPYQILRLDTDRYHEDDLAAYSNSLILNKVIYVPLFGIAQDSIAMQQWRDAMPGYEVKGFEFIIKNEPVLSPQVFELYEEIGWTHGDALHCRTRAVWDPDMLYISVDRLPHTVEHADRYPLNVIIKDHSRRGLITDSMKLYWRRKGDKAWKSEPLHPSDILDRYVAYLPGGSFQTIEYYVTAGSYSGRKEAMPRTAPAGFYAVEIENQRRDATKSSQSGKSQGGMH